MPHLYAFVSFPRPRTLVRWDRLVQSKTKIAHLFANTSAAIRPPCCAARQCSCHLVQRQEWHWENSWKINSTSWFPSLPRWVRSHWHWQYLDLSYPGKRPCAMPPNVKGTSCCNNTDSSQVRCVSQACGHAPGNKKSMSIGKLPTPYIDNDMLLVGKLLEQGQWATTFRCIFPDLSSRYLQPTGYRPGCKHPAE